MAVANAQIAELFDQMADLLEISGANSFRIRAYRNAARAIRSWPESLAERVHSEQSTGQGFPKIPGVGADLSGKIHEIVATGRFRALEEVKQAVPAGLVELLAIEGLGPKRAQQLYEKLNVQTLSDLERAIEAGALASLRGFGPKLIVQYQREIGARRAAPTRRMTLRRAEEIAIPLLSRLRANPAVIRSEVAGSFRRGLDTVGDIDILVSCRRSDVAGVIRQFLSNDDIERVVAEGLTKCSVVLHSGIQVDLRVVVDASFGAALHYFTGAKAHNVAIRALGVRKGLKINEYGVFRGTRKLGGTREEDVFQAVGLPFIEPELREDGGEIEAARSGRLPRLVNLSDIRGDLHAHTTATDGRNSIEEMVDAARARGYDYLAITDHSKRLAMAHGLDRFRLIRQMEEIDRLNEKVAPFRVLKGCEVDILEDGSLDLPDEVLARLDLTVCSIHSHFGLSAAKQFDRIRRAMEHPCFTILGHPTARLMDRTRSRAPIQLDLEKVLRAALDAGCFVECNAQPERLDLEGQYCRLAGEIGVMVVISTDSHSTQELDFMRYGLSQARRGWLEARQVLNTRPWSEVAELIRGQRDRLRSRKAAA